MDVVADRNQQGQEVDIQTAVKDQTGLPHVKHHLMMEELQMEEDQEIQMVGGPHHTAMAEVVLPAQAMATEVRLHEAVTEDMDPHIAMSIVKLLHMEEELPTREMDVDHHNVLMITAVKEATVTTGKK